MRNNVTLYEDQQLNDFVVYENKNVRQEGYEEKRRRAELILERKRLRKLLDEDDLDFEW